MSRPCPEFDARPGPSGHAGRLRPLRRPGPPPAPLAGRGRPRQVARVTLLALVVGVGMGAPPSVLSDPVGWLGAEGLGAQTTSASLIRVGAQEDARGRAPEASQELRPVVFNEVAVSSQGASITLEFEGGVETTLELRGGVVRVDGSEVGRYTPGGPLDRSWRALLGEAITADNGAVARLLAGWTQPDDLSGSARDAADALGDALRNALRAPSTPSPSEGLPAAWGALDRAAERSLLGLLIERPELAATVASLLEGAELSELEVRAGDDVRVGAEERIEGSLLVLNGDLRVEGTIEGDAFVLNGTLRLEEEGRILGMARVADGEFRGEESAVEGGFLALSPASPPAPPPPPTVADIRREIEQGIRDGMRDASPRESRTRSGNRFFRNLVSGIGGVLQTGVSFLLLLGMGMGILYFFPRHFEVVARSAAAAPGRALATGWAALLLSPVIWVFGVVFFAITIIGIPVMILWLPLFWVALALATLVGFLALSRNIGTWWVRRGDTYQPQGLDPEQPAARMGIGLALLLSPFVVAALFDIGGGLFSIFRGLTLGVGVLLLLNVAAVGLGATLLSRGGRDRRWSGPLEDLDYGEDPFGPPHPPAGGTPEAGRAGSARGSTSEWGTHDSH